MLFHGKIYEVTAKNIATLFVNTKDSYDYAVLDLGNIMIKLYGNYKVPKSFEIIDCIFPSMKTCKIELFENYIWKNYVLSLDTGHRIDLENNSKIEIYDESDLIFEKDIKY